MNELSPRQHELLGDLLAGDRDEMDPEIVREAEQHPLFAERLAALSRTEDWLTGAEEDMDVILREAANLRDVPGEANLVEHVLGDRPSVPPVARASRPWLIPGLTAAAALLLIVGYWFGRDGSEEEIFMGDGEIRIVQPVEPGTGVFPITWEGDLSTNGSFTLRLWNAGEAGPTSPPLILKQELVERTWTPTPEERARMARRIVIEVSSVNSGGLTDLSSPRVELELSVD